MDSRTCKEVMDPEDLPLKRVAMYHSFQKRIPALTVLTCHLTNRTMPSWPNFPLLWKKPLGLARNSGSKVSSILFFSILFLVVFSSVFTYKFLYFLLGRLGRVRCCLTEARIAISKRICVTLTQYQRFFV
jgi:hypothetical protein